ncbi:MAG: hypothetical protein ACLT98_02420 [Eggerthellaceae bacterium]
MAVYLGNVEKMLGMDISRLLVSHGELKDGWRERCEWSSPIIRSAWSAVEVTRMNPGISCRRHHSKPELERTERLGRDISCSEMVHTGERHHHSGAPDAYGNDYPERTHQDIYRYHGEIAGVSFRLPYLVAFRLA